MCHGVKVHDSLVIRGSEAVEEAVADGEEGHVFDVGIVLGRVGDNVVNVVVSFPPAYAETTQEVGDQNANASVQVEGVGDAHMAGIMRAEDELVPGEPKEEASQSVLCVVKRDGEEKKEEGVTDALKSIGRVGTIVEACSSKFEIECAVLGHNLVLGGVAQRRVHGEIRGDLFCRNVIH